jgi:hypothetical protein
LVARAHRLFQSGLNPSVSFPFEELAVNRTRFSNGGMISMLAIGVLEGAWLTSEPAYWTTNVLWPELLIKSAGPMAGILGLGLILLLLSGSPRSAERSFLTGFVAYGMGALFVYVPCSRLFTSAIYQGADNLVKQFVLPGTPTFSLAFIALFLVPQLLIAVLGGALSSCYQIKISIAVQRRRPDGDGAMLASQGL